MVVFALKCCANRTLPGFPLWRKASSFSCQPIFLSSVFRSSSALGSPDSWTISPKRSSPRFLSIRPLGDEHTLHLTILELSGSSGRNTRWDVEAEDSAPKVRVSSLGDKCGLGQI